MPHSDANSLSAQLLNDSHDSAKSDLSIQNESISQQIYKFADESTNIKNVLLLREKKILGGKKKAESIAPD